MDFFENGFLSNFPETLYNVSTFTLNNVVLFVLVAIVALELSRRLASNGAVFATLMIIGAAAYVIGATKYSVW